MSNTPRREVDDRLADWVDGRLGERERERMVAEMRVNPQLRADLEQYERTVGVLRAALRAPTAPTGAPMADRVLAAIAGAQPAPAVKRSRWSKRHAWWSLASAAALLVGALWIDSWSVPAPSTLSTTKLEQAAGVEKLADADAQEKSDGASPEARSGGEMPAIDAEALRREKFGEAGKEPAKKEPADKTTDKEKGQTERTDLERSEVAAPNRAVPPPEAAQAPATPTPAPTVPAADGKPSPEVAPGAKDAGRSGPGAPLRGQPGGAGGGVGTPAGPATGGPVGETGSLGAPAAPASKPPAADPVAADDLYLTAKAREKAPAPNKAEQLVEEIGRSGSPAAPGVAAGKPAGRVAETMLALVEIEGTPAANNPAANNPAANNPAADNPGTDKALPTGGRGGYREKAETKDKDARELDASRGLAKAPLAAPALQASLDQFLASASQPATDAAADRWITTNGVLQVSPWIHQETPAPAKPAPAESGEGDRRARDTGGAPQFRAASAVTERTWLVEGNRKDVELLLARVAAFARERKWTLHPGEIAAPAEVRRGDELRKGDKGGEERKADAEQPLAEQRAAELLASARPEGLGADPMRVVLRIRLRAR